MATQHSAPKSLSKLTDFSTLQYHVTNLPQELQDEILLWLIRIILQPGKIYLDSFGKPHSANPDHHTNDPESSRLNNISNVLCLSKAMLEKSAGVLYAGNTWVMPSGAIEQEFFQRWDRRDLRLLPTVELQPASSDKLMWFHTVKESRTSFYEYFIFSDLDRFGSTTLRMWLMDIWGDRRITRDDLMLDVEGHDFKKPSFQGSEFKGLLKLIDIRRDYEREIHQQRQVPHCRPERRTVLGVRWLEGRPDQVLTINEEARKRMVVELKDRWRVHDL